MVGLKISSEEIKEIIPILGLADDDQGKVYLSLLSMGTATLGQISILSGLDYVKTQEALQVLVGSKLIKRIPEKVGRYIALEPFLKSFLLAYDPITLTNIRKESKNSFKLQTHEIDGKLVEIEEIFQKRTAKLENDFSENLTPVLNNFSKLTENFQQVLKSLENQTSQNIENLHTNTKLLVQQSEELNNNVYQANLQQIHHISEIFEPFIPKISHELDIISNTTKKGLEEYRNSYKSNFGSLGEKIQIDIAAHVRKIDDILNKFESDRVRELKEFEGKIANSHSSLDILNLNANQSRTKFLDIKHGYNEIDESIKELLGVLGDKLTQMESLIVSSTEDIQSRKFFKGKEEYLANLAQLEADRKAILQILKEKLPILEKINNLNRVLDEAEEEIVQATETGLMKVKTVLDDEIKLLSNDLQDINENINTEFRTSIQGFLDTSKQELQAEIMTLESTLDQKTDIFSNKLDEISKIYLEGLSKLAEQIKTEFKAQLDSFFKKEDVSEAKEIGFESTLKEIDQLRIQTESELNAILNQISELEETHSIFISSINVYITSFTDTQEEKFNSTVEKVKEILNIQMSQIEQQIEQEISALTFSIKEMKQKLTKISDLSRLAELSEIEPSLISSGLVVGETSIIMMLRDLTLRAKSSLTILMPRPELQTLISASKLPMKTRVNIIGDFNKVPESTLRKILSSANIRLKQLDNMDFWGCIRDAEELLICPEPKHPEKEELIGVITTNENLVELFSQELMTYTTRSREIVL
ncbi:MAG: hypothetical protein JSV04_00710 [Candidatus Heimdallarchaeota archaeon]|nr:MAG: hypothetical protein JSV04_00710 [Candidatus Heimdallarchaeota archaeon]